MVTNLRWAAVKATPRAYTKLSTRGGGLLLLLLLPLYADACSTYPGRHHVLKAGDTHLIEMYFSMFYFSINCGAFLSSIITPKLRADTTCFGRTDCFPLAFGLPGQYRNQEAP